MTQTATPNVIAGLAARLIDSQDREAYAALVSYVNELPPGDEFRKLTEMLGLMSLLGQRLPDALAEFLQELRSQTKAAATYHDRLDARLAALPSEIAAGVDPRAIAKAMSESFRQQLSQTALHDAASLMKAAVITLKGLNAEVAGNLRPLTVELSEKTTMLFSTLKQVNEVEQRTVVNREKSHPGTILQSFLFFAVFVAGGVAGYWIHH